MWESIRFGYVYSKSKCEDRANLIMYSKFSKLSSWKSKAKCENRLDLVMYVVSSNVKIVQIRLWTVNCQVEKVRQNVRIEYIWWRIVMKYVMMKIDQIWSCI